MAGYIGRTVPVATSGTEHKKVFTATSGQTSFTGLSYTPTKVHVFQNGVRLVDGTGYTASNGTSITLTVGATTDDQIVVVSYATFQPSDTVSASTGGTFLSGVTFEDSATFKGITTFENTASFDVSGTPFVANRIGSTGTILDFQKDGVDIGTMGTVGGKFYIGSLSGNDAFLKFESDILSPANNIGQVRNNAIDLGKNFSAFKDLYLGGGVYLGGTGAANKLDDYEEGTWTPILRGSGGNPSGQSYTHQTGTYTKVGRKVHVQAYISVANIGTGMSGTYAYLSELPFTISAGNSMYSSGLFGYVNNLGQSVNSLLAYGNQGSNFAYVTYQNGASVSSSYLSPAGWGSAPTVMFGMTYFTDA